MHRFVALFVSLLLAGQAFAGLPTPEQAQAIVAQRQADSENPSFLLLENSATKARTNGSIGDFSILPLASPCNDPRKCRSQWFVSGEVKTLADMKRAWDRALAASGGQPPQGLVFDFSGGDAAAGLWLGERVIEHGIHTRVEDWGVCLSACVFSLSAGKTRTILPWAIVGVHAQRSSHITEEDVRQGAAQSPAIAQAIAHQPEGAGESLTLPLSIILDIVDNVSKSTQARSGQYLHILGRSGVSPLLYSYTVQIPNTRLSSNLLVLPLPCSRALALDNATGRQEVASMGAIERACGPLRF